MSCSISDEQIWSWMDSAAPELEAHLAVCPQHRAAAKTLRRLREIVSEIARPPAPDLPARIGNYTVLEFLGAGGQATVYRAEQSNPRRQVALKVLANAASRPEMDVFRFEQEVQALATFGHEGIATVYEAGYSDGRLYCAMELVNGRRLTEYVQQTCMVLKARLRLFAKVCAAVDHAHRQGVIHRDLKPANILVNEEGQPKVIDFGLASWMREPGAQLASPERAASLLGTLRYISPEQARGLGEADARSDVYSLGVILYELVTESLPYAFPATLDDVVRTICEKPPRPPSTLQRAAKGDLELIILKALQKDPQQRYQSARALLEDIERYLGGFPVDAHRRSRCYPVRRWFARHGARLASSAALAAVLALVILGGAAWRQASANQARVESEMEAARRLALEGMRVLDAGSTKLLPRLGAQLFRDPFDPPEVRLAWAQCQFREAQQSNDEVRTADVIKGLRAYVRDCRNPWPFQALLAEVFEAINAPRPAELLREEAEREMPQTAEAAYVRSFATLSLSRATEYAELAVKRDPNLALAWERLTYLYILQGATDQALVAVENLVHLRPNVDEAWLLCGAVLICHHDYRGAIRVYSDLAARKPKSRGAALRGRALAYTCLGEFHEALQDHNRIVLSNPQDYWSRRHRAAALSMCGRTADAVEDYARFCDWAGHPEYAHVRLYITLEDMADMLLAQDRVDEAQTVTVRAAELVKDIREQIAPEGWLGQILHCLTGQLPAPELIGFAERQANPELLCEAYYYAGEACRLAGNVAGAREFFRKCVAEDLLFDRDVIPLDPMTESHLAHWRLATLPGQHRVPVSAPPLAVVGLRHPLKP